MRFLATIAATFILSAAHECIHDDLYANDPHLADTAQSRQLYPAETTSHGDRHLASSWEPIRITYDFMDVGSDPDMTTAKGMYWPEQGLTLWITAAIAIAGWLGYHH